MSEIVFLVEEAPEGGFTARALGEAIFVEGDNFDDVKRQARDAVVCHFSNREEMPHVIRLHSVKDELLAV